MITSLFFVFELGSSENCHTADRAASKHKIIMSFSEEPSSKTKNREVIMTCVHTTNTSHSFYTKYTANTQLPRKDSQPRFFWHNLWQASPLATELSSNVIFLAIVFFETQKCCWSLETLSDEINFRDCSRQSKVFTFTPFFVIQKKWSKCKHYIKAVSFWEQLTNTTH
jgi:hypothetical protein